MPELARGVVERRAAHKRSAPGTPRPEPRPSAGTERRRRRRIATTIGRQHGLGQEGRRAERAPHLGPPRVSLDRPRDRARDVAVLDDLERRPGLRGPPQGSAGRGRSPRRARGPTGRKPPSTARSRRRTAIDLPTVKGRRLTASIAARPGAVAAQICRFSSAAPRLRSPVPAKRLVTMPDALVLQLGDERPEVRRSDADVRVRDHVHLARRDALQPDELSDLRVERGMRVGDDEARIEPRMTRDEAPRGGEGRVGRVRHAEEDFERRVVDARERREVVVEVVVAPGERLEDRHARGAVDLCARSPAGASRSRAQTASAWWRTARRTRRSSATAMCTRLTTARFAGARDERRGDG